MTLNELNDWFCSLSVKQKEHIACKLQMKFGNDPKEGLYPNCWLSWDAIDLDWKRSIYHHCTDEHGMWIKENEEVNIFSF